MSANYENWGLFFTITTKSENENDLVNFTQELDQSIIFPDFLRYIEGQSTIEEQIIDGKKIVRKISEMKLMDIYEDGIDGDDENIYWNIHLNIGQEWGDHEKSMDKLLSELSINYPHFQFKMSEEYGFDYGSWCDCKYKSKTYENGSLIFQGWDEL